MSGPWEKYAAPQGDGPWSKYAAVVPQPSPGQQDQDIANQNVGAMAQEQAQVYEPDPIGAAFSVQPTPSVPIGSIPERRDLQSRGVVTSSMPAGERLRMGFGRNERESLAQRGLESMVDPTTGRTLYRANANSPWQTVSEPGIPNLGDIASLVGPAVREIPAMVGGVGGSIAGGAAGTAAGGPGLGTGVGATVGGSMGSGIGTLLGESARLNIGQKIGEVPQDADVLSQAMGDATFAAALAAGGSMMYSALKAFARRGMLGSLRDLTPEQYEAYKQMARNKIAGTGLEDTLRPSQVFGASDDLANKRIGDELAALEQQILRQQGPAGDKLAGNIRTQAGAIESAVGREAGAAPTLTPEALGQAAERAATRGVGQDIATAKTRVGSVGQARGAAQQAQTAVANAENPGYIGDPLRRRIESAYDQAETAANQGYERARAGLGNPRGVPTSTIGELQSSREFIDRNLIPALTEEDRRIVEPTLRRLTRPDEVQFESGAANVPGRPASREGASTGLNDVSLDEINTTLRAVRRELRRTFTGVATADIQQLLRIEGALSKDRAAILGPQRAQALELADRGWAELRDTFQRAPLVGKVMANKPGGAEAIEDFSLGRAAITNPDNARAVATALRYDSTGEGKEAVRRALRYEAQKAAGLTQGKPVNPDALQGWISDKKPILDQFFTPQEINQLGNIARTQREFTARQSAMEDVVKNLSGRYKDFGVKKELGGTYRNPAGFFDDVMNENNPTLARDAYSLLRRRDRLAAEEFQARSRQSLVDDLTGPNGSVNGDKLNALLGNDRRMQVYREVLGRDFEDRIKRIGVALDIIDPETLAAAASRPGSGFTETVRQIARATVSPLTSTGRRITGATAIAEGRINERIARAMVDDDAFRDLLRKAGERRWNRALYTGAAGAYGAQKGNDTQESVRGMWNGR